MLGLGVHELVFIAILLLVNMAIAGTVLAAALAAVLLFARAITRGPK